MKYHTLESSFVLVSGCFGIACISVVCACTMGPTVLSSCSRDAFVFWITTSAMASATLIAVIVTTSIGVWHHLLHLSQ